MNDVIYKRKPFINSVYPRKSRAAVIHLTMFILHSDQVLFPIVSYCTIVNEVIQFLLILYTEWVNNFSNANDTVLL